MSCVRVATKEKQTSKKDITFPLLWVFLNTKRPVCEKTTRRVEMTQHKPHAQCVAKGLHKCTASGSIHQNNNPIYTSEQLDIADIFK